MDAPSAKSVLLIDDDEELCDLLRKFLGHEGFEIEITMDGQSGLERAVSGEHSVESASARPHTWRAYSTVAHWKP